MPDSDAPTAVIAPAEATASLRLESLYPATAPLELDIGCGKGQFLVARAAAHPEFNFLGIDRMQKRIRRADRKIVSAGLSNVRLLRAEAYHTVAHLLPPLSVSMVHVFFPDPWPKRRHHPRRLFSPVFMDALHTTLMPDGQINLATDDAPYFEAITSLLDRDTRFVSITPFVTAEHERTCFERLFMEKGAAIHRCSYRKVTSGS